MNGPYDFMCENCGNGYCSWDHCCSNPKNPKKDAVNSPSHYQSKKFEVIEVIEEFNLDFSLGNAIKYILRAGKKDEQKYKEDLEKAIWYINRHIKGIDNA